MAGRVELSVVAKNQASKVLKQVGGDIRGLSKEAGNAKSAFGEMFSIAGGNLLARGIQSATSAVMGLGKAFVGLGVDAVQSGAEVNAQISGITAVLGLAGEDVEKVSDLISDLAMNPKLKVDLQGAAGAIDVLARNGLKLDQIMGGAAESSILLANATGGGFESAASVMTDVVQQWRGEAGTFEEITNGVVSTTDASKLSLEDYALGIAAAGGVMAAYGVEFKDFNAALALTVPLSSGGSDAGTSLKSFVMQLVPTTAPAMEAMAELGLYTFNVEKAMQTLGSMGIKPLSNDMNGLIGQLMKGYAATHKVNLGTEEGLQAFNAWAKEAGFVQNAFYDANGQMKDMADISQILGNATAGLSEADLSEYLKPIFGPDGIRAAIALAHGGEVAYTDLKKASQELGVSQESLADAMKDGVITQFEAMLATMGKADAMKAAAIRNDNLAGDMDILSGTIESVKKQLSDNLDPALRTVAQAMNQWLTSVTPQLLAFGNVIGTKVTSAVTRLTNAFGVFKSGGSVADIGKALGISPKIIGAITWVIKNINLLKGAIKGIAVAIAAGGAFAALGTALAALTSPFGLLIAGAALLGAAWETNFGGIRDITNDVAKSIGGVLASIQDFLTGADVSAATTALTQSFTNVKSALGELFSGDIGIAEFTGKISDAVSGIPAMVNSVFSGADFSAVKGEIVTALGLDNVSFDLGALQTNISNAISAIDWSQVATQFGALKDSIGTALNSVRDGILSSLTSIINGINWSGISFSFAGMIDNVASTINGIDWSQISIADIGIALAGVVAPVLTNSIRGIAWVLNSDSWAGLATAVKSALTSIQWGEIGQSFLGLGTAIINAVTGLDWSAITSAFETLKTSIVSAVSDIDWSAITSAFETLKTSIVSAVSDIDWSAIDGTFETLKTSIVSAVSDIDWSAIDGTFETLKTSVVSAVSDIDWSAIDGTFETLKTTVSNTLIGINWSELSTNFVASANTLRDNLIQSLADKINNIDWSQVSLNVAGFINQMASTISSIDWSQMVVNFAGFVLNISNKISSIDWSQISVGEIGAALGAVVAPALTAGIAGIIWVLSSENLSNLTSAVSDAIAEIDWEAIGGAFGNLATAVVDSVTDIDWSPIGGAFAGLATSVIDAITDLDWSGVTAPFTALGGKIQSAVNSALSSITFGFFGGDPEGLAAGTDNWKGGWTWVGERGPELLNLPKGSQVLSNTESKKMIGQLADGTTTAAAATPKGGGNVFAAISAAAANMGRAGDKMSKAGQIISDSIKDLEANLRKVPGLFGASQVTKQQMKMAELGIPQNFADDWLRRLTDEVVNGVNWEGVDIKDAALRAGLDPALPAEAILELVTQKWNDKSLFANPANLDLINQDAVKAALEAQAQQAAGEQNLLGLFGVTPEQARTAGTTTGAAAGGGMLTGITQSLTGSGAGQQVATSIATGVTPESMAPVGGSVVTALATELGKEEYGTQVGAALAGLFTGYLEKADAFADVAQRIIAKIADQFSNVGTIDMVSRFVESFRAQLGSEEAIASLTAVGEKILELVFRGYLDEALRRNWAEGVNAKGDTSNKTTTSARNAIGTSSWRGGLTMVGETGPELVSLPARTRIFNPAESLTLAGAGGGDVYVTNHFVINNEVDFEAAAYRIVDIINRRRR